MNLNDGKENRVWSAMGMKKLTKNSGPFVCSFCGPQDALDRSFMLVSTTDDSHLFRQVKWTYECKVLTKLRDFELPCMSSSFDIRSRNRLSGMIGVAHQ